MSPPQTYNFTDFHEYYKSVTPPLYLTIPPQLGIFDVISVRTIQLKKNPVFAIFTNPPSPPIFMPITIAHPVHKCTIRLGIMFWRTFGLTRYMQRVVTVIKSSMFCLFLGVFGNFSDFSTFLYFFSCILNIFYFLDHLLRLEDA